MTKISFKTLLILLFLITGRYCFSQTFKAGVIVGINTSQVEGDGFGGYKKLGSIIGGFANTSLSEKWSTQFEIYYTNKGSRKNANPSIGDFSVLRLNLDYIEIPISLRYHYKKFMFETGLYYGSLLNSSIENEFGQVFIQNFPFKNYDIGGFLGFYYQLNDNFTLNVRSKNSLLPIRDLVSADQTIGLLNRLFNRGWYNVELNFSIRYQFGN